MSAVLPSSAAVRAPATETALDVRRLAGRIGAEIRGVRLSGSLAPETFAAINDALLRHKVLFFRGQQHLDDAEHQAFGRLWGEIEPHPTVPSPAGTRLLELDSRHGGRANSWHTDVTFEVAPPKVAVLRAVTIPELGGDTQWANTVAAYEGLPEPLKALAGTLRAVHGNDYDYAAQRPDGGDEEGREKYRKVFTSTVYEAEHPLVRVHPETGERALLLGHFAKKLVGYSSHDSQRLIEIFNAHILRPENTVRWHWAQGDVAVWDNRATQHYAVNDYGDAYRVVRRVTVSGDVPVGVDGGRSKADGTAGGHRGHRRRERGGAGRRRYPARPLRPPCAFPPIRRHNMAETAELSLLPTVLPTGAALGADVIGIDLNEPLTGEQITAVEAAWAQHLVLRFRGQRHLTIEGLAAFSANFGALDKRPIASVNATYSHTHLPPEITVISNVKVDGRPIGSLGDGEAVWHADMTYIARPPRGACLYAVEVPPAGGNTWFANMYEAYETLPAELKAQIQGLGCVHDASRNSAGQLRNGFEANTDPRKTVGAIHPFVIAHTDTGRQALLLGRRPNAYVPGLSLEDSEALLDRLWAHATQSRFTWSQSWQVGDVMMWDNTCSMHRRDAFDPQTRRLMYRTQFAGAALA